MSVLNRRKTKSFREEEQMIDNAVQQNTAPAPQPVSAPQMPQPVNPALIPPQPGMIPTGWMFPQDSPQAAAMETGDVNVANAPAPGAGTVDGKPVTNEEAQLVSEYRKWSKQKRIEAMKAKFASKLKEADEDGADEDEIDVDTDSFEGTQESLAEEDATNDEDGMNNDEIEEELKNIAIDINTLFADIGGDLDDVMPDHLETQAPEAVEDEDIDIADSEEEDEGSEEDDLDDESEDDEEAEDELSEEEEILKQEKARIERALARIRAKKLKESELSDAVQIKFPVGSEPEDINDVEEASTSDKIKAYEKKVKARRALLKKLRQESLEDSDYEFADPDATIEDSTGDIIDEVIPDQKQLEKIRSRRSAIAESSEKSRSEKFLETYRNKRSLDFRALLEQGLLG